jgi:DNA-binding response OmpR family regulator
MEIEPHPHPMSVEPTLPGTQRTRPWRVVVAEDDREMRHMIASVIAADGYEVIEAADGNELVACLEAIAIQPHGRGSIATVICDIRMPRLDGLDVLAALRCAGWYTPVIVITAFGDEAVHDEAHHLGATHVLDKPFALETLRALVHGLAPR